MVGYRLILLRYENALMFLSEGGCGHENLKSRVILRDGGNGCPNILCYWLVFALILWHLKNRVIAAALVVLKSGKSSLIWRCI